MYADIYRNKLRVLGWVSAMLTLLVCCPVTQPFSSHCLYKDPGKLTHPNPLGLEGHKINKIAFLMQPLESP